MTASALTSIPVERDAQGFLLHPEQWTEQIAEMVARESGIDELTDRHWEVINSMRRAFVEHGTAPWIRMISKVSGIPIDGLYRLFGDEPSLLIAKIAGIPKRRTSM